MIEHLLVSTIVLAAALVAAPLLPLTARTRHALLVCGIGKFAIPTAAFTFAGVETIAVMPAAPRVFGGTSAAAAAPSIDWLPMVWAVAAALLFTRWLLLRTRTIAAALRSPAPASPREHDALEAARRQLGVRIAVDLLRSPICEAPAVLRVLRPVIVLPFGGCDHLADAELRALLLHELAHVRRRDNFVSALLALAAALLWFHPLVWLALRRIDVAREQACDETVAEAMGQSETYLDALTKVCRAAVAPRTAGASCMAGANVKERMDHLMRYETLRARAWSHRAVLALSVIAVLASSALAARPEIRQEQLYSLRFTVLPGDGQTVFDVGVIENASNTIAGSARITTRYGQWGTMTADHKGHAIEVRVRQRPERPAELFLEVKKGSDLIQRALYTWTADADAQYTGEPVSLNLKDAQLTDVLRTFGEMTGYAVEIAPGIEGTVSVYVQDEPWDKVLDIVARQAGVTVRIENKTIHVLR